MKKQKRLKNRIKHIKHADDALKQLERVIQGGGSVSDAQIVKMEEAFAGIEDSPPCEAMEKAGKALPGIRNLCVQGFASSRGFFWGGAERASLRSYCALFERVMRLSRSVLNSRCRLVFSIGRCPCRGLGSRGGEGGRGRLQRARHVESQTLAAILAAAKTR